MARRRHLPSVTQDVAFPRCGERAAPCRALPLNETVQLVRIVATPTANPTRLVLLFLIVFFPLPCSRILARMWRSSTCSTGQPACSPCGSKSRDSRLLFARSCKRLQMGSTSSATLKVFECTQQDWVQTKKIFWHFLKITSLTCLWLHLGQRAVFWFVSIGQICPSQTNHKDVFYLICLCQGGLICRGILSTLADHNVQTFISLSSPQAGQYGGK